MFKHNTLNKLNKHIKQSKQVILYCTRKFTSTNNTLAVSVAYNACTTTHISCYTVVCTTAHYTNAVQHTTHVFMEYKTRYNTTQYCLVHKSKRFNINKIRIALARSM